MNERIHELANQAGFSKDKYDLFWDEDANAEGVDLEKFAELIVKECIANVKDWENDSRNHISYMLEKHFGVAE